MGTENDRVPRLDGHDALEEHRRSGVRNRREREDDPDRFRHLHQVALRKLANDADRAFVLDVVVDKLRGHHVLEGLVFQDPELGFLNRQAGQILSLLQASQDHRLDNAINVLLGVLGKDGGGGSGLTDQSFQVGNPFFTEAFCGKRDLNPLLHCFACDHRCPLIYEFMRGAHYLRRSMPNLYFPDFPSSGDNEVGRLDRRAQLFLFLLCVVDGMPLQPVLITHPANVPQSTTSDARGQTAGFPSDTCSESNGPAREAECQRSADRSMAVSGITAQHTDSTLQRPQASRHFEVLREEME